MILKFTKMHGIGNDYVYFDCVRGPVPENLEETAILLSDRHFGVGGDGIVLILPSQTCDFRMRMFNADGSEGKMCGNASRCVGKFVYERGLTDKTEVTLETLGGVKVLKLNVVDGTVTEVTVDMGKAAFKTEEVPAIAPVEEMVNYPVEVDGREYRITCVSVGNPHCVIFGETPVREIELEKIGPKFENLPIFPERINTEFVRYIDETTLEMRVWERGSGETLACGTGASATVSAAVRNGFCKADTDITVKLIGGDLKIRYCSDGSVFMTGPATIVFDGETL